MSTKYDLPAAQLTNYERYQVLFLTNPRTAGEELEFTTLQTTLEPYLISALNFNNKLDIEYFNHSMSRQSVINGNFDIWQRGTTVTNPVVDTFLSDHWKIIYLGGTPPTNVIHSRQILTSGNIPNSFYYYRIAPDGAGSGMDYHCLIQQIEKGVRYLCGLNEKVTVSFWARSSIAGKRIAVSINQDYGTGGSPTSVELLNGTNFTLTSTWTKYTYTFTTNTLVGKTFGTNGDDKITLLFWQVWNGAAGSLARTGSLTAETFVGAGNIDIAQVQLCAGDVALPFQPKSDDEELMACMRYCQSLPYLLELRMLTYTANTMSFCYELPRPMRVIPTLDSGTPSTDWIVYDLTGLSDQSFTSIALHGSQKSYNQVRITATKSGHGLTDGYLTISSNKFYLAAET